jgi:hypothetical protein
MFAYVKFPVVIVLIVVESKSVLETTTSTALHECPQFKGGIIFFSQ